MEKKLSGLIIGFIVIVIIVIIVKLLLVPTENLQSSVNVTSKEFTNNQTIPKKFTCDGIGVNPSLEISNVPPSTKELLLVMDDPDAPGGTFTHWLLANIDPKTTKIQENYSSSDAGSGKNSAGSLGYFPPCPPSGTHRYVFKIYALKEKSNLKEGFNKADAEKTISQSTLGVGELVGKYSKANIFRSY